MKMFLLEMICCGMYVIRMIVRMVDEVVDLYKAHIQPTCEDQEEYKRE